MPATAKITKRSTMQEVLDAYPSAQRALFGRFHIGGCNSCGYEPEDVLEEVAHRHNLADTSEHQRSGSWLGSRARRSTPRNWRRR